MFVDSHCHLNFPELKNDLPKLLVDMRANSVSHALVVATRPDNIDEVIAIASSADNLFASVGIHPDEEINDFVLTEGYLIDKANSSKVIAIGETGLDYYRSQSSDMSWQHERFQIHINVAKAINKPLVIHTRSATNDTFSIMEANDIASCGAVMHCFTESIDDARKFLNLGCYISLSGIVTFKNALQVQDLAKFVPLDRLLIETDAPYLAPVPFRGKTNQPAYVKHTAEFIANLRGVSIIDLATYTTNNFKDLFRLTW